MKIKCHRCGFVTSLIIDGNIIRRDFNAHGNRAEGCTCFNCNTPLQLTQPKVEPDRCETADLIDHSPLDVGGKFTDKVDRDVKAVDTAETKVKISKKTKKAKRKE